MRNPYRGLPKEIQRELRADYEKARRRNLRLTIEELYAQDTPDDLDALTQQCHQSTMAMIKVRRVGFEFHDVLDLDVDREIKDVFFPAEVAAILKKGDVFLATLGSYEGRWFVIWLSPPYDSASW